MCMQLNVLSSAIITVSKASTAKSNLRCCMIFLANRNDVSIHSKLNGTLKKFRYDVKLTNDIELKILGHNDHNYGNIIRYIRWNILYKLGSIGSRLSMHILRNTFCVASCIYILHGK
jgi:hypothetical protein